MYYNIDLLCSTSLYVSMYVLIKLWDASLHFLALRLLFTLISAEKSCKTIVHKYEIRHQRAKMQICDRTEADGNWGTPWICKYESEDWKHLQVVRRFGQLGTCTQFQNLLAPFQKTREVIENVLQKAKRMSTSNANIFLPAPTLLLRKSLHSSTRLSTPTCSSENLLQLPLHLLWKVLGTSAYYSTRPAITSLAVDYTFQIGNRWVGRLCHISCNAICICVAATIITPGFTMADWLIAQIFNITITNAGIGANDGHLAITVAFLCSGASCLAWRYWSGCRCGGCGGWKERRSGCLFQSAIFS